jgi:hypothetical protein
LVVQVRKNLTEGVWWIVDLLLLSLGITHPYGGTWNEYY